MKSAIAFDLGTTSGWASRSASGLIQSGTLKLKGGRFEGGGMRFLRFQVAVQELIDVVKPEILFFEEVRRHMGVDAAHVYGALLGSLTALCEAQKPKIPYSGLPVGTIKKHATGSGAAKKDMMIATAKAKWPEQHVTDDNHADALWILDLGITEYHL